MLVTPTFVFLPLILSLNSRFLCSLSLWLLNLFVKHMLITKLFTICKAKGCVCSLPISGNGPAFFLWPMLQTLECSWLLHITHILYQIYQHILLVLSLKYRPKSMITLYYLYHQPFGPYHHHQLWKRPSESLISFPVWFIVCEAVRIITSKHRLDYATLLPKTPCMIF